MVPVAGPFRAADLGGKPLLLVVRGDRRNRVDVPAGRALATGDLQVEHLLAAHVPVVRVPVRVVERRAVCRTRPMTVHEGVAGLQLLLLILIGHIAGVAAIWSGAVEDGSVCADVTRPGAAHGGSETALRPRGMTGGTALAGASDLAVAGLDRA